MKIKKMEKLWIIANKLRGAFEIAELHKVMLYQDGNKIAIW